MDPMNLTKPTPDDKSNGKNQKGKKQLQFKLKLNLWTIVIGLLVVFFIVPVIIAGVQSVGSSTNVQISQLVNDIKVGKVKKILIESDKLVVTYKDGSTKLSTKESTEAFGQLLKDSGIDPSTVNYSVQDQSLTDAFGNVAGIVLPLLLMAGLFYYLLRAQNKGAQDIFSFGRSRAKVFAKGKQNVTFADVAGVDEAKKELEELVDFL